MSFFYHELKNHINRDPLSDWFEITNNKYNSFKKDTKTSFQLDLESKKAQYKTLFLSNFKDYELFYENINHKEVKKKIQSKEKFIISKPTLYNKKLNVFVKPDLIFHRDIFKHYFPEIQKDLPEYIIIDIIYKNIHFNADKSDILNSGSIYYHKCKMYVAYSSLGLKGQGYFFGKEYRHKDIILPKREYIGYFPLNEDLKMTVEDAINWLIRLKENYDKWLIYPKPSIKELYPNMNRKTGEWLDEKTTLAHLIKEITMVWNISYNKRCLLHDKGITEWDDPVLLSNVYPYKVRDNHREYVQNKMININSQQEILIEPRKIKNYDFLNIIKNQDNSIILDIESVVDFEEKESYFTDEKYSEIPKICIIGTILNKDEYIFKDFTIRFLNNVEERKIICYWIQFLKNNFTGPIKVYHWGNAEKVYLKYMKQTYPEFEFPEFEMIDLLSYFKAEPITIKGCFGYGLKEIVKQLYSLNLIQNQWLDDTTGLDAMVEIKKISELAKEKNIPLKRFEGIKKIVYYNYMDCRVIVDILKMLEKMI